jgi:aminoglycoside phosphotransferase (APT) family kinase protein
MSTIGDPFMDLGTSLAYWIQNDDPDFIKSIHLNITSEKGNPSRGEILKLYQNNFGHEIDNIVFYFTYGLFKIAVIVQQIYFRYKNGLTKDTRFKDLDKVVKAYGKMAKQSIQKNKIECLF